jgi:phage terminase small subunit
MIKTNLVDWYRITRGNFMKLTDKQEGLFKAIPSRLRQETALAFIKNGYENKKQSYLAACKKMNKKPSKNPETSASEILSYSNVTDFIDSVQIVVAESVNIDAEWVLRSAKQVFDRCMQFEGVVDKQGAPVLDPAGNPIYKFEPNAANKSLEIIGKHVKVRAFEKEEKTTVITNNIMPVPVADSVESWEEAAQKQQNEILGNHE